MPAASLLVASGSDRVRLAAVAVDAATRVPGVVAVDPGPARTHLTTSGAVEIPGVSVVAEPGGRYSVDLGLCARLVPLEALAEAVGEHVAAAADSAGLGHRLGTTSVTFHDVVAEGAP